MSEPFRCDRCTVLSANRLALGGALVAIVLGIALGAGGAFWVNPQPFAPIGMFLVVLGIAAANAFGRFFMWPRRQPGEVQADVEGIRLDGTLLLARERAERGFLRPVVGQPPRLRFVGPGDKILLEIETPDEETAKGLLRAAELDTKGKVARFTLNHPWFGKTWAFIALSWAPLLVGGVVVFGVSQWVERLGGSEGVTVVATTAVLAALVIGGLLLHHWSRTKLVIGRDGIHVGSFGQERYITYDQIEVAERWPSRGDVRGTPAASEGFDLMLRSGVRLSLRTIAQRIRHGDAGGDFILDEVRAALADRGQYEGTRLGTLDRGGRTAASWVQDLRGLGEGAQAGHRSAAAPVDELWRMLEDPKAEAGQRAASAVALAASGDSAARQRVGRLSRATANPTLRAALEAAAEGDLDELERAMSKVDEVS